jgi:hypothetical protein
MAVLAYTDAYLVVNSVNLSDHVKSVALSVEVAALDSTAMGDTYTENIGGLKSGSLAITFNDDFAASNVDATIWPALGTVVTFELRPTSAAVGATNPKWTGSILVSGTSVGGGVGELGAKSVTWPTSGTVTRAIA